MKTLVTASLIFFAVNFGFAINQVPLLKIPSPAAVLDIQNVINADANEEEALKCEKKCPDGTTYACWLCNCSNLPACSSQTQVQQNQ